nr:DUF262 domain-containing HNH endonuclease family protein [Neobacillus sp. Marseille-Q6967]
MGIKNFGFETIETYLQKGIYYIPDYQREYSWLKDEQIDDFWTDIVSTIEEDRDTHFFGQVVIHDDKTDNKKYVIDGQQRTTTSVIFLAVLRDLFEEVYNESNYSSARNKFEDIRLKFIGRWSEDEDELRLTLGRVDKDYFRQNIQINRPRSIVDPEEPSHRRIKEAYKELETRLRKLIDNVNDSKEKYNILVQFYNKFINGFQLMYVETDEINEAFIIFETLNARGKDLETSDLLKNHLFRSSGSLIEKVKDEWMKTVENIENIDITKFLRHYWNSQYRFTREKDLYKKIRTQVNTPNKSEEFVKNFRIMSDVYKNLVNPTEELYFLDTQIQKSLQNMKTLSASSFYPIILSMVNRNFNELDIKDTLDALESFIVRNVVVAGKVANKYEILFAKIAHKITEKELTEVTQIYDQLKPEMLVDEDFEMMLNTFTVKSTKVAKFLLREINDFIENEVQVLSDNRRIHLEHIMPKKTGEWNIDDETHQKYLNRLGNLTLLGQEFNTSIQNKPFDLKKQIYARSSIKITQPLCDYSSWDEHAIEKRQKNLSKVALRRWKLPENS